MLTYVGNSRNVDEAVAIRAVDIGSLEPGSEQACFGIIQWQERLDATALQQRRMKMTIALNGAVSCQEVLDS